VDARRSARKIGQRRLFPNPTNQLVTYLTGGCASRKTDLCLPNAEPVSSLPRLSLPPNRFLRWGTWIASLPGCCYSFCSRGPSLPSRRRCRCRIPTRIAFASPCRQRLQTICRAVITMRRPRFIRRMRQKRLPPTRSLTSASAAATTSAAARWPGRNGRKPASGDVRTNLNLQFLWSPRCTPRFVLSTCHSTARSALLPSSKAQSSPSEFPPGIDGGFSGPRRLPVFSERMLRVKGPQSRQCDPPNLANVNRS
jgi:hypothetical protein